MGESPIIEVEELVAQYGEDRILDRVSFNVRKGEIFVILGGSGCGKSTLLRHMVGLERAHSGTVRIHGDDISDTDRFHEILKRIGVLFQGSALLGSMTVAENVALPITEYTDLPQEAVVEMVSRKLRMVGLECYGNHLPAEISGGMKKRAGLARSIALNPEILFLDEPSAGLDPVTSAEIDELILMINRTLNTTVVIVTHELASIFAVGERGIMLDKSEKGIIAEGNPKTLKDKSTDSRVRRFFHRGGNGIE